MVEKLNFGCGRKILKGYVNVDIQKHKKIDYSFDFNKFPYPLENDKFSYILVDNVLEHLDDPAKVLEELHRISKNNAIIHIIVPYYNCSGAYNDVTHKNFFNERSFEVLSNSSDFYWLEQRKRKFAIKKNELVPTRFGKLIWPKKLRMLAGKVFGEVFSLVDVELQVNK
ncbi:MAG TPA: methyltransferase domain-containing protein [Candidatus Nanoarchaeia archaeon]|nr:methyltransferase domain-containing protein [Candidatus Nanoarchaeia archaeon]